MENERKKIYLMRPSLGDEELQAVKEVFASKFLTEGDYTKKFEQAFANYLGAKHALATTSCTRAMELALRVLNIGPGDEVIVPDFTHPATGNVVFIVGAKPVLVDVDRETYNIDYHALERAITKKTKAILPVSLFGNPLEWKPLKELQAKHGFYIIEDAACSAGAEVDGKKVGSQADITCFSLHPRKIITTGEGGMFVTNDDNMAEKAKAYKCFGFIDSARSKTIYPGSNYLFSNILGAIGLVQLSKIESILRARLKAAGNYTKLLSSNRWIKPPKIREKTRHTFQSYCVYLEKKGVRDKLKQHLVQEKNIEAQIGTYALHLHPTYDTAVHSSTTNSTDLFQNLLTLPLHSELSPEDQDYVVDSIQDFLSKNYSS